MVSTNNDEGKELSEDDLQNPKPEEEVMSEAKEEVEEARRPYPRTTIASIGVVENPHKFKRGALLRAGGGVPRHLLAEETSSSGNNNPFHSLIHKYQFEKVPQSKIPSGWDIHRSNNAGRTSAESDAEWGNSSKSWDSQSDKFMNRIEHNTELIRLLTYKIDELKELIDKLIKDAPSKE